MSAAAIAAMRPNGVLVNVGRGRCVDEEALIEGGRGQTIRRAGRTSWACKLQTRPGPNPVLTRAGLRGSGPEPAARAQNPTPKTPRQGPAPNPPPTPPPAQPSAPAASAAPRWTCLLPSPSPRPPRCGGCPTCSCPPTARTAPRSSSSSRWSGSWTTWRATQRGGSSWPWRTSAAGTDQEGQSARGRCWRAGEPGARGRAPPVAARPSGHGPGPGLRPNRQPLPLRLRICLEL